MSRQIAHTILNQMGGQGRLTAMTGAKNFMSHEDGVSFKFPRKNGVNYLRIILSPYDTYNLEWGYIAKKSGVPTYTKKSEFNDVYADQLCEIFEKETGLYTSL